MIASFRENMAKSPEYARFMPFVIFVAITAIGGMSGGSTMFWSYPLKTAVGAWMIWEMRKVIPEIRWTLSL